MLWSSGHLTKFLHLEMANILDWGYHFSSFSRWNYFHHRNWNWNFKIWLYYGWLMPFRKVVLNKRGCLTSNNCKVKITDCKDNVNPISHYHNYENSLHSSHFLSFYLQYILKKHLKQIFHNIPWHILFLTSLIRGPRPGSLQLYGLPSILPCRKSSCCGSFSRISRNSSTSFSSCWQNMRIDIQC